MEDPKKTRIALFATSDIPPGSNAQEFEDRLLGAMPSPQFQEILETHDG